MPSSASLKRQLLIWLLSPMLLIVPGIGALQYSFIIKPAKLERDQQLGDIATALSHLIRPDAGGLRLELTPQTERSLLTDQFDTLYFSVTDPGKQLIAGNASLAALALDDRDSDTPGFYGSFFAGEEIRIGVFQVPCGTGSCEIRVAETQVKQRHVRNQASITTLLVIAALTALTMLATLVAVTRGLRPLTDLGNQLADRSLHDLRPLDSSAAPTEVRPLVAAINQLFQRLHDASSAQRAFITDAAHQLRTPLAAMQTESELALLEPHAESARPTLQRIHQTASRAARLSVQLLALARLDPDAQASRPPVAVDLKDVAAETAREWSSRAFAAGIDLGFVLEPAPVSGDKTLLLEVFSNLVHNALEYAGANATVTVKTYSADGAAILEVEDDGPGIAAADRERMLRRFVRGRGAPGHGSGLGLAIVQDIALLHGATLSLETPPIGHGLLVRLRFPPAPAQTA